jgi:glycosyltransferase
MRVLVATSAWPTHYFIMQPTAIAFRASGHEVLVAAQPSMSAVILRSGLPAVEVGGNVDMVDIRKRTLPFELAPHEQPPGPGRLDDDGVGEVFRAWQSATLSNLDAMVDLAREWRPALVLADTMCPPGLVAAHVLGVPAIRHLWSTDFLGSRGSEELLASLPGFYEPYRRYDLELEGDPALRTVDPCPPSMQPPPSPRRMPVQYVPYNGAGQLADVRSRRRAPGSRRRVCLTWGRSTAEIVGPHAFLLPQLIRALGRFDVDVVVAIDATQRPLLGGTPDNVEVLDSPPLHLVLPDCDTVIHQGGSGSILNAARWGLRQLGIPYLADQSNAAEALAGTGAGIHLPGSEADDAAIEAAVTRLMEDDAIGRAAERLRAEILAQPTPAEVAAALADLAAEAVPGS